MNTYKLEYLPYTVSIAEALETINRFVSERKVKTFAKTILTDQELIEKLPEPLKKLIYTAKIREVVKKDKGIEYLAEKLRKKKTLFVRFLRLIDNNKLFSILSEKFRPEREVIETFEPEYIKVGIEYYYNPFFDFQRQNPIDVIRINRKNRSVYVRTLGSCSGRHYNNGESKKSNIVVDKTTTIFEDFPGILIAFCYDIHRDHFHEDYGYTLSSYSRIYGVLCSLSTGNTISFRFKNNTSWTRVRLIKNVKELSKLVSTKEKEKIKAWIKENVKCKKEITGLRIMKL